MTARALQPSLVSHLAAQSSFAAAIQGAAVLFAASLTAAAAQFTVPLPFTAVPFTLQPVAVLLTSAVLGARLGAAAQVVYLAAGIAGLPVWSASPLLAPGAARLLGPTGGYLMAYPLAAFVTGWLAERGWDRRYFTSAIAMTAGLGVIFTGGVSWLMATAAPTLSAALAAGFVPFFFLDLLKIAGAALVLPQAWRLLGPRPPSA